MSRGDVEISRPVIYTLMRSGGAYRRPEDAAYTEQVRERQERQLHRRARELGFAVVRIAPPAAAAEPSPGGTPPAA